MKSVREWIAGALWVAAVFAKAEREATSALFDAATGFSLIE